MSLKHMMKTGASTALAMLLAASAISVPAYADSDRERGGNGHRAGAHSQGGGNWNNRGVTFPRSEALPRGGGSHGERHGGWSRNNGAAPETMRRGGWGDVARENHRDIRPPVAQTPGWRGSDRVERDVQRDRNRWSDRRVIERDGSPRYSDPNRNRNYADRERRAENWRRDGDRRWDGRRDGNWDRNRDRWRDRDRNWSRDHYRSGWRSHNHRRWDNDWRRDRRYDWYSYRSHYGDRYRIGRYYSPYRHHHYNRVSIGFFLDSGFYGSRYWINDPWQYRLPDAYGPYRWVRYYDDVLLVDMYSGEVVDVIYDFFW